MGKKRKKTSNRKIRRLFLSLRRSRGGRSTSVEGRLATVYLAVDRLRGACLAFAGRDARGGYFVPSVCANSFKRR